MKLNYKELKMKSGIFSLNRNLLSALIVGVLVALAHPAHANQVMVFVDMSDSAGVARNGYFADFQKLPLKRGDTVLLLPLGRGTHNYAPFAKAKLPLPDATLSPSSNENLLKDARMGLLRSLKAKLSEPPVNITSILGAFVAAQDYFFQEKVPQRERVIYILSDMIEQSRDSGINMAKAIPDKLPERLVLPTDLGATVHMVGVTIDGAHQARLRSFWEQAVKRTGSTLATYRQHY